MPRDPDRIDGRLDLTIARRIDAPPALVWRVWTDPEHTKQWWAPAPWTTVACEMDLRPGGAFRTVIRSPEGQDFPHLACFLELVENKRIVWTNALAPGFRPAAGAEVGVGCEAIPFTAVLTLEAAPDGKTNYAITVMHRDEAGRKQHEALGFHDGWGTCLEQFVAVVMRAKKPAPAR